MLSNPKCVVLSSLRGGFCSAKKGDEEKARIGVGQATQLDSRSRFAARGTKEDMVMYVLVFVAQANLPGAHMELCRIVYTPSLS